MCSFVVLAYGYSSRSLPIVSFEEGYSQLFGDSNLMILNDGKSAHLSLDERTGFSLNFFVYDICNLKIGFLLS